MYRGFYVIVPIENNKYIYRVYKMQIEKKKIKKKHVKFIFDRS